MDNKKELRIGESLLPEQKEKIKTIAYAILLALLVLTLLIIFIPIRRNIPEGYIVMGFEEIGVLLYVILITMVVGFFLILRRLKK